MSSLQTTPSSTETAPGVFSPIQGGEYVRPTPAEMFVVNSSQDPRRSTNIRAADFWRRLSLPACPDVHTLHDISSVDMPRLLQPAFFSLLWHEDLRSLVTSITSLSTADLRASLSDLDGAAEEAAEQGFPQPSDLALTNARRLLQDLYRLCPRRLEVYPTPDSEIALVVPGGHGRSVLILCKSQGGVLCSVNLNGRHRRAAYDTATTLPDGFVREAISELDEAAGT